MNEHSSRKAFSIRIEVVWRKFDIASKYRSDNLPKYSEDEELAAREIRKCYYKNYKIYFFIDERSSTVYVLRVLHMLVNAKPLLLNMRL